MPRYTANSQQAYGSQRSWLANINKNIKHSLFLASQMLEFAAFLCFMTFKIECQSNKTKQQLGSGSGEY